MSDNLSFKDLYVVVGPSEIAKKLKVPLDQMWSYDLRLTSDNQDFIKIYVFILSVFYFFVETTHK